MEFKISYLLSALLLLFGTAYAANYDCNGCSDCTAKIAASSPGDIITLTTDTAGDTCIDLSSKSGLVYDCAGHTLQGTGQNGRGVQIGYGGNVTVKNCRISSFYYGIYAHDSDNNTFQDNVLEENNVGIYLSAAPYSRAEANTITGSVYGGIFIGQGSVHSSASSNEITSSSVYSYGIDVYMSDTASLSSNNIASKQYGIKITSSSHVQMDENVACGHTVNDFFVYLSTDDAGDLNTCTRPGGWNDTGIAGCTYPCENTTTTTSTTTPTTSTSSTTSGTTTTTLGPGLITCQSCMDCREKINSAKIGSTVYLLYNVTTSLDICVEVIGKSGVTFDCQNHQIVSSGGLGTYGIYLESSTSMTVKNCNVYGFDMGILLYNRSDYSAVYKNRVSDSSSEGISVFLSNHASVTDNKVENLPSDALAAIGIINSNYTIMMKNTVKDNPGLGILLFNSLNNTLSDNVLGGNGYGINLTDGSSGNVVSRNVVENNTYGISIILTGRENTLSSNTVCYNTRYDIYQSGTNNSGTDNTCTKARGWSDENVTGCSEACSGRVVSECRQTFGGAKDDVGSKVIETVDGGYAIIGSTSSFGAGKEDIWVVKTDENCVMEWNRTYGGSNDDYASSIKQTSDYGYVIAGSTASYGKGGKDLWLLKVSEWGEPVWDRTFGDKYNEKGYDVMELADGYLVLASVEQDSIIGAGNDDLWLVKTDLSGNLLWDDTLGGDGDDFGYLLSKTLDGGFVSIGYTRSTGAGGYDMWRVKISPEISLGKESLYGDTGNDYGYSCYQTSEGGYVMGGSTNSYGGDYKATLVKINNVGSISWDEKYGGKKDDYAYAMVMTYDGGYMLAGSTESYAVGKGDFWILKADSKGNLKGQMPIGGAGNETAYSLIETYDHGYVMVGYTDSYGNGGDDIWLVKTNSPDVTTTSTTTTTTTTSASSTTTTLSPCSKLGDYPPCDEITLAEIVNYINAWSRGEAELGDVIDLIIAWSNQE